MSRLVSWTLLVALCSGCTGVVGAGEIVASSPQAGARTYAQNYKDMALATCIANAYQHDADAAVDAGSSVSALRDWSYYDLEKSPDALNALVTSYLKRDYSNPLVEADRQGLRFDLLKCLDLYHSQELESLTQELVIDPERSYREDTQR